MTGRRPDTGHMSHAGRKFTLSSHVKLDITAVSEEGFSAIGLGT